MERKPPKGIEADGGIRSAPKTAKGRHVWVVGDTGLGHGTAICRYCKGTMEEMAAIGQPEICDEAPKVSELFNNPMPSDYERELLVITMEECSEVIQSISKILRFGFDDESPFGDKPRQALLGEECGQLKEMLFRLQCARIIKFEDMYNGRMEKLEKLRTFMLHEPAPSPKVSGKD